MQHREDIELLRGVSVLLVVLFHLELAGIESGFLGVDIFFVLSGFLMEVLYREGHVKDFVGRRARRLLPAYFVTILGTVICAAYVTSPNEFAQVVEQSAFALALSSNFGFWAENSYFSKTSFRPLLHLWSLGVEIQFYLFVPVLAVAVRKIRAGLPILIAVSLLACFFVVGISPKTSFFLLPFRLWEFLIGYAVARHFCRDGAVMRSDLAWVGGLALVALLAIPLLNLNGQELGWSRGHPGAFALLVTLAAAAILACGLPTVFTQSLVGRGLSQAGKYSYAIYLVHFPVIILFLYEPFGGTILAVKDVTQAVGLLVLIVALSMAMHHLVEVPARHGRPTRRTGLALGGMLCVAAVLGVASQVFGYSKAERLVFDAWTDRDTYRCGKLSRIVSPQAISCKITANAAAARSGRTATLTTS